jgi:hypothetical protein
MLNVYIFSIAFVLENIIAEYFMKKMSFLFLLVLFVFAGCKKEVDDVEAKLFSFDITHEKPFSMPKADVDSAWAWQQKFPTFSFPLQVSGVSSSSEASFQQNNTTTSLVKNIILQELILTVPAGSADDFTFLQKMDVYIAMKDGSEPLLMAYNRDIKATNGQKLEKLVFQPAGNTLDKYVKSGEYSLILRDTRLRRTITANMDVMAKLTFTVTASPLK